MGYEKEIAEYNIDYGPSFQQAHSQNVVQHLKQTKSINGNLGTSNKK